MRLKSEEIFMHIDRDTWKQKWFTGVSCFFMLFMFTNSYAVVNSFDKAVDHPPIPLLDEQGNHVLDSNKPYSPKQSCAGSGCHDYEAITHAYHFEMGRDEASDSYGAKRGLPHLVSPGYYGGYTCMSGDNPQVLSKKDNPNGIDDFADYGSAGYVKTCMSCHTGGGWAEKDRDGIRYDEKNVADIKPGDSDYYERHSVTNMHMGDGDMADMADHLMLHDWKKSGVGEADCMFCHVDFATLKLPEDSKLEKHRGARRARQALSGEWMFREAATGLMELVVDKDGKNIVTIQRSLDEKGKASLVLNDAGKPQFSWHADVFDERGRVTIPMLRFPANENCMECHRTSNGRRGFYGFGEDAKTATLEGEDATGILEDDYKDDIHKGKVYVDDNGESRVIDNCNACHSKQYFKKERASIDLDANHDFPKGNSDMDVRNDLDYAPNAKSCEECHITSKTPIIPSKHETLLKAHIELWKANGDMAGYSKNSLTQVTQTHFDVVSCQACHITDKKDRNGKDLPVLFRYRIAEDGLAKIVPYKPSARALWKDRTSGRVLAKLEKQSVYKAVKDAEGKLMGADIVNLVTGEALGRVSASEGRHGVRYGSPETYEQFVSLKQAYDAMLTKKGLVNPDTALFQSEANEYIISHNTRPSPDSVQCEECHERKQSGAFSALVSPNGIFGKTNSKVNGRSSIPDPRLVKDGYIVIDMNYTRMLENGDLVQDVSDILFETKLSPFMSLLRNATAKENIGVFKKVPTSDVLGSLDADIARLMAPDLSGTNSYLYSVNTGDFSLRNMAALVTGNTLNDLLFPSYRGILGKLKDAIPAAKGILKERGYGTLRSDVFYFEVRDSGKAHVASFNDAKMFVKVAYKGNKTNRDAVNVVVANWSLSSVKAVASSEIVAIKPAEDKEDGYVIFKMTEPGYFIVADK